jgi:hypothetical protein
MSFDLNEVRRLQAQGGAVLAKYERLVAAADAAMHGSPAHEELGAFQLSWIADPDLAAEVAREEAAEAAEAAEAVSE